MPLSKALFFATSSSARISFPLLGSYVPSCPTLYCRLKTSLQTTSLCFLVFISSTHLLFCPSPCHSLGQLTAPPGNLVTSCILSSMCTCSSVSWRLVFPPGGCSAGDIYCQCGWQRKSPLCPKIVWASCLFIKSFDTSSTSSLHRLLLVLWKEKLNVLW